MRLAAETFQQFARIQSALNNFIYAQLQQAAGKPAVTPFRELPLQKQLEVRDAFVANPEYVERFVAENPDNLSSNDLQVALGWRKPIAGNFYLLRHLKKYSIFLSATEGHESIAYGVVGLTQPISEVLLGRDLPIYLKAVLLPIHNQLVYDGLLAPANIMFGSGYRKSLTANYNAAKKRHGIVTSLPASDDASAVVLEASKSARKKSTTPRKRATKKASASREQASEI